MPSNTSAWVKTAIATAGAATAGPIGGILGRLAGCMLEAALPGMAEYLSGLAGTSAGMESPGGRIIAKDRITALGSILAPGSILAQMSMPEKLHVNHQLQAAFTDACCEALYDIGGEECFPAVWANRARDVPAAVRFPATPEGRILWVSASPLAAQVADCLQQLERAIRGQLIIPLDPPADEPPASANVYLLAQTPADLSHGFFEDIIWPFFARYRTLHAELPELPQHLQRCLLDRTLAHLGGILKSRIPAWRTFHRAVLEGLNAQVRELYSGQVEITRRLEALSPTGGGAELADTLAALIATYGQMEKEPTDDLDALARQAASIHQGEIERLESLAAPGPRVPTGAERVLHFMEDGEYRIEGSAPSTTSQESLPGEPPYMGLHCFDETDAHLFFGRELLTARLAYLLEDHPLLVVTGASGSGKSSLVRAGLIPALRSVKVMADGRLPPAGAERWPVLLFTPTAHPFDALAASLSRGSESMREALMLLDDLKANPGSLEHYAHRLAGPPESNGKLLLVIDQFEELFTLCHDPAERQAFVHMLTAPAANGAASPLRVVITLRADFSAACAQFPALREALTECQVYTGPLEPHEVRRAIEEPARRGGWSFEPGLVERILRDAGWEAAYPPEPGVLPLLSHALLETWKHRRGRMMTMESYAETGGVRQAIARTADSVYRRLDAGQQIIARRILLRLADLGDGAHYTGRRARLDDLNTGGIDDQAVAAVLHVLGEARLVIASDDSVEIAHEALVREWTDLQRWLEENRESIAIQRRLSEAAEAWQRGGQDTRFLYRGARLAEAGEWAADHTGELNTPEAHFLEASQALQQSELASARQAASEQSQSARRMRRVSMALAGALLLVTMLAGCFLLAWLGANSKATTTARQLDLTSRQRDSLIQERDRTIQQLKTAEADRLAAERQQDAVGREKEAAQQSQKQAQAQQTLAQQAAQAAETAQAEAEQARLQALAEYTQAEIENGWWLIDHAQYPLAKEQFERALARDPQSVDAHLGRAWAAFRSEDFAAAITSFEAVRQAQPGLLDAGAWNTLGWAYKKEKQFEKALAAFDEQLRLSPNSGDAYYGRGVALAGLGQYQPAVDEYLKAARVDPVYASQADLYSELAVTYAGLNDSAKEEEAAARAIGLAEKPAEGHAGLGWAYYRLDRYDRAIAHFTKAVELDPGFVDGYNGLGWASFYKEDYPAALQYFEQGLALAPANADLCDGLGSTHYRLKNYPQAIAYLEKAIALDESRAYFANLAWLGWANFHINNLDAALAYFERASQFDPQAYGPYQGLGDVYYQRKETEKALLNYEQYLALVEGSPEAYVVARVKELKGQ